MNNANPDGCGDSVQLVATPTGQHANTPRRYQTATRSKIRHHPPCGVHGVATVSQGAIVGQTHQHVMPLKFGQHDPGNAQKAGHRADDVRAAAVRRPPPGGGGEVAVHRAPGSDRYTRLVAE